MAIRSSPSEVLFSRLLFQVSFYFLAQGNHAIGTHVRIRSTLTASPNDGTPVETKSLGAISPQFGF